MKQHGTPPQAKTSYFEGFYQRFLQRYSVEEFEKDKERFLHLQGVHVEQNLPAKLFLLLASAREFFSSEVPSKAQCEALLSVRLGGVSTRTIRNWRRDGHLYSESSSSAFNRVFDCYLSKDVHVDRRRLAWFWVAYSLKLNENEVDNFLIHCMEGQRSYAFDLFELVIRACISFSSLPDRGAWDFFDAINFGGELEEDSRKQQGASDRFQNALNLTAFSQGILNILRNSSMSEGGIDGMVSDLSLLYEKTQKQLKDLHKQFLDESQAVLNTVSLTRMFENVYGERLQKAEKSRLQNTVCTKFPLDVSILETAANSESLSGISSSNLLHEEINEYKAIVKKWVEENSCYFQAAHFSRMLTMLRLLIECGLEVSRNGLHNNFFEQWYYWCSLTRNKTRGASAAISSGEFRDSNGYRGFPADPLHMADILLREEGIRFARYSQDRVILYFSRLFDAARPISRRDFIEYYLLIRLHRAGIEELNVLLRAQRFSELNQQQDHLLLLFFSEAAKYGHTYKSPEVFAAKLGHFSEVICSSAECTGQSVKASSWHIHEKLFIWNHPVY